MAGKQSNRPIHRGQIIRIIAFIGIFLILYSAMAAVFSNHPDYRIAQSIGGFYEEPAGSLQGVYVGSSNCYAFWNALVAWKNYGLTVYPYACASLPFHATEYVIREARKTQPDALYIVNVNSVDYDDLSVSHIYHIMSYMPESKLKWELRDHLCDQLDLRWWERLELYFPWVRMRQYWTMYLDHGIFPKVDGMKGSSYYGTYLTMSYNLRNHYRFGDQRAELPDKVTACINSLLDYCEAEKIRVLFVSVPRAEREVSALGRINTACDIIRERGFDLLYLTDKAEALNLDLAQDYYENKHTNIHGSIKFTDYLSKYLISEYGLVDQRGDPAYESWDRGWERYQEIIAPYVLDVEVDTRCRDYTLKPPKGMALAADGSGAVEIHWRPVEGADAYCVYRKDGSESPWHRISQSEACDYTDTTCQSGVKYRYTVVPVRRSGEALLYGGFQSTGQGITL